MITAFLLLPTSVLYRSPLRPMEAIVAAGVVDNGAGAGGEGGG